MTFEEKRKMVRVSHPLEGVLPNFSPDDFPGPEDGSPGTTRQGVLPASHRRGIKKAPIAVAAATVAFVIAGGWGTPAQAREVTDPKGAPIVTMQQARTAGQVAEEVAKREQDLANDSWVEKALASILEGDVVPFVALADAMLAGVGGEDLAQAFGEGSEDKPENPSSDASEKEQGDPKTEGFEGEHTQADKSSSERAAPDDAAKSTAETPTAKQDSDPEPGSDRAGMPSDDRTVDETAESVSAFSGESGTEDGSSGSEQAAASSSASFSPPSPSVDAESGGDATPVDPGDAPGHPVQTAIASADESSGGGYEADAFGDDRSNGAPTPEEASFGFAPAEDGEPSEGTSNEEIGASDESKKAVQNYIEGGEENYLEDSLKKDVEDKTTPSEARVPESEGGSSAEGDEETNEGQALGEGFVRAEKAAKEASPGQEAALEETSFERASDAKKKLPVEGFEAASPSEEEQSSWSGVHEALRDFLEAIEQGQSAEERSGSEREGQERAPADESPTDASQGVAPTAARAYDADPEGEPAKTPLAGDGPKQDPPADAPAATQEQPEKEEKQDARGIEQQKEAPKQDRQQPIEGATAPDRAQAVQSREQAQHREQQPLPPHEGGKPHTTAQQACHQDEPKQPGSGTVPKPDGAGLLDHPVPVLGVGRDEPAGAGGALVQQSSALGPGQEGRFTSKNNDRFEQRLLDDAASSAPGRATVDGVDVAGGPSRRKDAGAPTQYGDFDSDNGGGSSWRFAGGDLPSAPVQPTPDQAHATSTEPEVRDSTVDGTVHGGGGHGLGPDSVGSGDRDLSASGAPSGGGARDGGGRGGDERRTTKG